MYYSCVLYCSIWILVLHIHIYYVLENCQEMTLCTNLCILLSIHQHKCRAVNVYLCWCLLCRCTTSTWMSCSVMSPAVGGRYVWVYGTVLCSKWCTLPWIYTNTYLYTSYLPSILHHSQTVIKQDWVRVRIIGQQDGQITTNEHYCADRTLHLGMLSCPVPSLNDGFTCTKAECALC